MGFDRTFTYKVDKDFNLTDRENDVERLSAALGRALGTRQTDSPLYDLVNGISFQNSVAHEKTDVFRERVSYDEKIKKELAYARLITDNDNPSGTKQKRIEALDKIVEESKPLENVETGVLIDMMISYRNIEAFEQMNVRRKQLQLS